MPRQGENNPFLRHDEEAAMVQNQLNILTMTVGELRNAVENLTSNWVRQDQAATDGRKVIHDKIDEVRDNVIDLTHRVEGVEKEVKIIQPSIKIFNDEKLRDEGARSLGKLLWAAILTGAGLIGWGLHEWFAYLVHK
jgi:hypothetical protein